MTSDSSISGWIQRWLESEGFDVNVALDGEVVEVVIPHTDDRRLRIIVMGDSDFIVFSMVTKATVPRKRWTALYPLLSQANAEIVFGAWVLDPDTETIVFRASVPGRGAIYEPDCLRAILAHVARTVGTMESQFRGTTEDDVLSSWLAEPPTSETLTLGRLTDS